MKVERIFNNNSNIKLEDIVNSIFEERIDKMIEEYYNSKQVNFTTSNKKEDVA